MTSFSAAGREQGSPDGPRLAVYHGTRYRYTGSRSVGGALPDDAYDRRAWWEEKGGPHSRSWLRAGWRVEAADVLGRVVTFVRDGR